jgi:hypothetical protein
VWAIGGREVAIGTDGTVLTGALIQPKSLAALAWKESATKLNMSGQGRVRRQMLREEGPCFWSSE